MLARGDHHSTIICMVGLPGSGKSTLARALLRKREHAWACCLGWGGFAFSRWVEFDDDLEENSSVGKKWDIVGRVRTSVDWSVAKSDGAEEVGREGQAKDRPVGDGEDAVKRAGMDIQMRSIGLYGAKDATARGDDGTETAGRMTKSDDENRAKEKLDVGKDWHVEEDGRLNRPELFLQDQKRTGTLTNAADSVINGGYSLARAKSLSRIKAVLNEVSSIGQGGFVICDDNSYYKSMRKEIKTIARECKAQILFVMIQCSVKEAMRRNEKRHARSVPALLIERMNARMEIPKESWSCVHVDSESMTVDEMTEFVYLKLLEISKMPIDVAFSDVFAFDPVRFNHNEAKRVADLQRRRAARESHLKTL